MKFSRVTVRLFKSYLRNDDSAERAGFVNACRAINNEDTNTFLVLSCALDNINFIHISLKYYIKNKVNKPDVGKYQLIEEYRKKLVKYRQDFLVTLAKLDRETALKLVNYIYKKE